MRAVKTIAWSSSKSCADLDAEDHNCLVERLFPHLATVTTSGQLINALITSSASSPVRRANALKQ
jgi:hypothetical protein